MARIRIPPPDEPVPRPGTVGDPDAAPTAFASELRQRREGREAGQASNSRDGNVSDFLDWARRLLTAKGKPLDFERFAFQQEIYEVFADDEVKDAVLMKGVQVGASELLVRLTLFYADTRCVNTLYVFPALKQMRDFADTRVEPLLEQNAEPVGPNSGGGRQEQGVETDRHEPLLFPRIRIAQ